MEARAETTRDSTAGVAALLLAATLWSLNGPLIKLASQGADGGAEGVPGVTIACYRSLIGGLLFLVPAWLNRASLRGVAWSWRVASVLTFTGMTACFVIATTQTAAASAIVLQYISPVVVFALSPLVLRETPRWREGLVLILAMIGVAIIFLGHERSALGPLVLAAAAGVGYGALTVVLRGLKVVHPATVVAINFLGSGLLLLPFVLWQGAWALTAAQFGVILLMSVVQFSLPYAIFQWGLQRVEAHRAALIVLLEPVLNPILTWLIVGEPVPRPTLLGGPLILLSVLGWMLLNWRGERRAAAAAD